MRRIGACLVLVAGVLAMLASTVEDREQIEACCDCLARNHNEFVEPCVEVSTARCAEQVRQGEPVPSSSRCLRDLCAGACGQYTGEVTTRLELNDCCSCLAREQDPVQGPCLLQSQVDCVAGLDNGRVVSTTLVCIADRCADTCGFLLPDSFPDAG